MNQIKFVSNRPWLNEKSISTPSPVSKDIPDWFKEADRFYKMPDGEYAIMPDGGKVPTWKACPALLDVMTTGYFLKTPCDIEFFMNSKNEIDVKVENPMMNDFCTKRQPMPQFEHPEGYYKEHFAWFPDWAVELPDGYSALYTHPLNRFDLPFFMTVGIIDNDKVNLPGTMPFFLNKNFTGLIKAGTPYIQIIPFKREDWTSEIVIEDINNISNKNILNSKKYRIPNGGVYKNSVWTKRKYE